jgi:hypothetical protein
LRPEINTESLQYLENQKLQLIKEHIY